MEKILIIGNGFDLAHDLPTKYMDFLDFCKLWNMIINSLDDSNKIENAKNNLESAKKLHKVDAPISNKVASSIKWIFTRQECRLDNEGYKTIQKAFQETSIDENGTIKDEFTELIKNNIWIEHFYDILNTLKENWIDFECEIYNVLLNLSTIISNSNQYVQNTKFKHFSIRYRNILNDYEGKQCDKCNKAFVEALYADLTKLIRALEIYFDGVVNNLKVNIKIPVILDNTYDKIISFNYTNTYKRLYNNSIDDQKMCFIHGKATLLNMRDNCNLVLGTQEVFNHDFVKEESDYLVFKKFYQRIYKGTDSQYLDWLNDITGKEIVILGHSLDVTDQEVLKPFIEKYNVSIYHHNKTAMGSQIQNLLKFVDSKSLINKTGGNSPLIRFVSQNK